MPLSKNNLILQPTNVLELASGAGLKFDGVNDYVTIPCPLNSALDFDFADNFSFSVWGRFRPDSGGGNDKGINRIASGQLGGYDIGFVLLGSSFSVFIVLWNGSNALISVVRFIEPMAGVDNLLNHYVFVKDTSDANNFRIYKNGVPLAVSVLVNAAPSGTMKSSKAIVLNTQVGASAFCNNTLYDLKAFNKTLTQSEVNVLFDEKGSIVPATALANLVANYTFNQKTGTSLIDAQGNNGTLINFAITSPGAGNAWVDDLQNSILF